MRVCVPTRKLITKGWELWMQGRVYKGFGAMDGDGFFFCAKDFRKKEIKKGRAKGGESKKRGKRDENPVKGKILSSFLFSFFLSLRTKILFFSAN